MQNGLTVAVHRFLLVGIIAILTALYFATQDIVGILFVSPCILGDRLQAWTASINAALHVHPHIANALLIGYSAIGDLYILICAAYSIWRKSLRIILPLFLFILLRQLMQILVTFPTPPEMIWHYPGFPSLFVSYNVTSDYYFSAYVGVNLLVTLEFMKYKIRWLTIAGFAIVFIEAFIDIVLRSHYTPDLYTSVVVAVFCCLVSRPLLQRFSHRIHSYWVLILFMVVGGLYYYILQAVIGLKPISTCGIVDRIQLFFAPVNEWLHRDPLMGDAALITVNGVLDLVLLWIIGWTVYSGSVRLFLPITFFLTVRQILQLLVSLPIPAGLIWHYPGFPSLFQSYKIAYDFYFSGHTGVATIFLLGCILARRCVALGAVVWCVIVFLLWSLRVHYTMDIFTAALTAFCLVVLSEKIFPSVNQWLKELSIKICAKRMS